MLVCMSYVNILKSRYINRWIYIDRQYRYMCRNQKIYIKIHQTFTMDVSHPFNGALGGRDLPSGRAVPGGGRGGAGVWRTGLPGLVLVTHATLSHSRGHWSGTQNCCK